MTSGKEMIEQDRRLRVLQILNEFQPVTLVATIATALRDHGHLTSEVRIREDLLWLGQQGLLVDKKPAKHTFPRLSKAGRRVAKGTREYAGLHDFFGDMGPQPARSGR